MVFTFNVNIVGFPYKKAGRELLENGRLSLDYTKYAKWSIEQEPTNKADPFAVAVLNEKKEKVAYISRSQNREIFNTLENFDCFPKLRITEIFGKSANAILVIETRQ